MIRIDAVLIKIIAHSLHCSDLVIKNKVIFLKKNNNPQLLFSPHKHAEITKGLTFNILLL